MLAAPVAEFMTADLPGPGNTDSSTFWRLSKRHSSTISLQVRYALLAEINSITMVRIQPAQPTSLPVLGISALCPENAASPRPFEPESELETLGTGAFGAAE